MPLRAAPIGVALLAIIAGGAGIAATEDRTPADRPGQCITNRSMGAIFATDTNHTGEHYPPQASVHPRTRRCRPAPDRPADDPSTIYLTTSHTTVALDAVSCVVRWRYVYSRPHGKSGL